MTFVFRRATLFDATDGRVRRDAVVVVDGEEITAVGREGEVLIPEGDSVTCYDLAGKFLMPGLIDSHIHITGDGDPSVMHHLQETVPMNAIKAAQNARRTLEAGFTTIRDAGGDWGVDIAVRDAVDRGLIPGPRMKVSGKVLSITGGHGDHFFPDEIQFKGRYVVDSPDEARKAAREQIRAGADLIKVCATGGVMSDKDSPTSRGMTVEEMRAAIEEAHNVGNQTLAHAQGSTGIMNAVEAGIDSIEHGFYLTDQIIEEMIKRDVFLVPTLVAVHQIVVNGLAAGIPEYGVRKAKQHRTAHVESFRRALAAGVKIAMGTDAATPFNYHGRNALELELMVKAGMTPVQALLAVTKMGAELIGWKDKLGTVEGGKWADLIVVDGDPLRDIACLQDHDRIKLVMKGGRVEANRGLVEAAAAGDTEALRGL